MDRFRVLDEIEPPDQWDEVVERIGRPETAAGVERRRRRPVGVLVAVAAVVALLVGAVAYRVADDGEGGRDQVRTDSPTTTAATEGAQLPPAPGPLACPPELLDISALGLAEPPFLLPPDERAGPDDAEKYVARWPVEEQTVEVQLPVPGVIDFAGERTEQVGEELLWYREGSVQLRFGPYPDGRCSFGVTVYGPDEAANAARAVEVGRAIRVRELLAPGSWQEVAAPGLVGVYASAWTGTEHLYWGGEGPGVGYEPVTGRVRRLAPGPNPFIKPLAATWTGTEVLVCCTGTEAAYDPETDEWREIAPSPMVGFGAAGAWAGDRWYVLGGSGRLTSYEPEADRWEELRAQPLAQLYSEVEWTGEVLAVTTPQSSAILLYDPASDSWSRAQPPRELEVEFANLVWTGQELVRFGLSSTDETLTAGAAYDPTTGAWRRLADAPLPARPYANKRPNSQSAVWTGDRMLVYAGHLGRAGSAPPAMLAYDPEADRWQRLASLAGAGARPELTWAGDRVLLRAAGALYELAV